jgi:septal ring factor EnvC (AmiA/AmiB activator)
LRHILIKLGRQEAATASEHDLHASGVLIASQRNEGAKLLHKALDRRHRVSINRFDKAKTTEEVRAAWKEAVQRGEIPGAYWAALSHPATNDGLLREIFADVHMLSHLVGAANRADIRRLRQLEDENAELEAKVARQRQQLRDAIVSRDATIRELRCALEERIVDDRDSIAQYSSESDSAMWVNFVADLKRRLATVESHCERLEGELAECRSALAAERDSRAETEKQDKELRQELDEVEASLADIAEVHSAKRQPPRLSNLTLHQPCRDDSGQTDLPSIRQTISAAARRRIGTVLRHLEQA